MFGYKTLHSGFTDNSGACSATTCLVRLEKADSYLQCVTFYLLEACQISYSPAFTLRSNGSSVNIRLAIVCTSTAFTRLDNRNGFLHVYITQNGFQLSTYMSQHLEYTGNKSDISQICSSNFMSSSTSFD